jgi:hypothetical protein
MGLTVHSLGELPAGVDRKYFVYLLDYGWEEPLADSLYRNFPRMADIASRHDAVVVRGVISLTRYSRGTTSTVAMRTTCSQQC